MSRLREIVESRVDCIVSWLREARKDEFASGRVRLSELKVGGVWLKPTLSFELV